jgi:hypothetical protein
MISAGFEHGGNVVHRHLDGHPNLFVYPFESQLGNSNFNDFLASIERVQYRYPEFPEGLSASDLYEQIIDEEMKTFLRKRNGSKFKDVDLILDENERKELFVQLLGTIPYTRKRIVEAFFRSTFKSWKNCCTTNTKDAAYVGYSPMIGLDSERIIKDFSQAKIIHIVRNPFSAYADTKRRPFPQKLHRYIITWNILHSTLITFANMYPENVKIIRYEDFVADKKQCMRLISEFIGVDFNDTMLYPSWNGNEIKGEMRPWGTVLKTTEDYNKSIIDQLDISEKKRIIAGTICLARYFKYHEIDYLAKHYAE